MYIVTSKEDVILSITETIDYESNGNVLIGNNQGIAKILVGGVFEVEEIPEEVQAYKYCYTKKKGFYKNPNYEAPKPVLSIEELTEQVTDLQLALAELVEGGIA